MNESYHPERLLVPLVTPFDAAGRVDEEALARHSEALLSAGAAGVVALATTSETSSLDDDERALVVGVCARVCAEHDAVLVVGAGTNIPYRTGRGLGSAALLELAQTDNIVGVKQAVGGIDTDTLQLLAAAPPGFSVLGGDDAFLYPLVLMGGRGAIAASANVATALFAAMIDDGLAGNLADGRARAAALLPLVVALFAEPSPAVIKGVLHATAVTSQSRPRPR